MGLTVLGGCATEGVETGSAESNIDAPPPSLKKIAYAQTLRAAIDAIDAQTAIAPSAGVDRTALYARLEKEIFAGSESPATLVSALRKAELEYPSGHLGFSLNDGSCWNRSDIGFASSSRLGACTQPYKDHAVVSSAAPGGLLRAGDEILAVDGKRGAEMMQAALEQPMCTMSSASESNRRFMAGTSIFAVARVGMTVEVKHIDGTIETKTVAPTDMKGMSCRDAFGAPMDYVAKARRQGDIGIIRVPALSSAQQEGETLEQTQTRVRAELLAAFEEVKDAKGIIWDLRANGGGTSMFGIEIVAGLAGAQANVPVGSYRFRVAGTNTFYEAQTYRVPERGAYAYDGKVAFLIDGLTISAADYTARAAKLASNAILVGQPTSGSYGGGGQGVDVGANPAVHLRTDPYLGVSEDGQSVIEGQGTEPTIAVELEPKDLAEGRDTVLERALAELQ